MASEHLSTAASDRSADTWLGSLALRDGVHLLSEDSPYDHVEEDYDAQYGVKGDGIEKTIATFVFDAAGFVPETVLEVACGTGHLTGSLLYDGRIRSLVASDASARFLQLTKRKTSILPASDRLQLLQLADTEFNRIPENMFDAIMMRSALHHFVDYKAVVGGLLSKLRPGGALFMLEPRADFHITASLILSGCRDRAGIAGEVWTDADEAAVASFVNTADFYLSRGVDKEAAEDKFVFHTEEFLEIARANDAVLSCLGGEYESNYSSNFHDFLKYGMMVPQFVLDKLMRLSATELAFMDRALAYRRRYAAAEWFMFRKV